MAHFEIKDLSFSYPVSKDKLALDHINLNIEKGEYIAVCGKSGSGKTTLLKHLKSTLAPHGNVSGEIFFEGKPLKDADLREQSSKIGYVMQNPDNQIVTDKVWHELAFGLESLGIDQKTIRLRVAEMASYFGIQRWFHKDVAELSGGQKQRCAFARAVICRPKMIMADEPTGALDSHSSRVLLEIIAQLNKDMGTTVFMVTHDAFCSSYADRILFLKDGKIFNEIRKGEKTRSVFYHEILDVLSLLGGEGIC